MTNLKVSSVSDCSPTHFLEQHPLMTDALLADFNYNHDEVVKLIKRVLQAPTRCQLTSLYLQAVVAGQRTFLMTNLNSNRVDCLFDNTSTWLIGRDSMCAITLRDNSVSRCHAVIGYHPIDGVYIADVGSSNGTLVNCRRLAHRERRTLQDGDLLQLGELKIEFFLASRKSCKPLSYEPTYS